MSKLILCTHDRASLVSLAARNLGSCQEPCLVNFYGFLSRSTLSHFTIIGLISSKILIISTTTWQTQLDGAPNLLFSCFYWRLDVLLEIYSLLKMSCWKKLWQTKCCWELGILENSTDFHQASLSFDLDSFEKR